MDKELIIIKPGFKEWLMKRYPDFMESLYEKLNDFNKKEDKLKQSKNGKEGRRKSR